MSAILKRHFLKNLFLPLFCCLGGFVSLFIMASIHNELGDFGNKFTSTEVVRYFIFLIPSSFNNFLPISVLLGTMYCFSNFNHNNEIIACRAAGISLFQMSLPLLIFSLVLCVGIFLNNEFFIPHTQQEIAKIKEKLTGFKNFSQGQLTYLDGNIKRQWIYDIENGETINVYIYQLSNNVLLWDLYAKRAKFDKELRQWNFVEGNICYYKNSLAVRNQKFKKHQLQLGETMAVLLKKKEMKRETSIRQIYDSLQVETNKKNKQKISTQFYSLIFGPFASFIAMLIAIPFAISNNRHAKSTTIASAIPLMLVFIIISHLFFKMGYEGFLSPLFATLTIPILFILLGIKLFYQKN